MLNSLEAVMLATHGGLTVRSSTWGSTFFHFFFQSLHHCL